jgi:tRNA dimethylallyltransferase
VIVGPTASGKTALGIELAGRFNGEIICADSRTVYRGLDIGTAKPTDAQRRAVRHHMLDVVEPDGRFSVADFKALANQAIAEIAARGKLPLLIGGSGLYVDALIFNYGFAPEDLAARRDPINPRHLSHDVAVNRDDLRPDTLIIGIKVPADELKERIARRVEAMFAAGLIDETKSVVKKYGWNIRPLQAPGYKAVRRYLDGSISLDEAKREFRRSDTRLAKRQMTWFRRNKGIQWHSDFSKAVEIVTTFLNKTS